MLTQIRYWTGRVFDHANWPNMATYVFRDPGAEVIPGVYIGSINTARDRLWLNRNGIRVVINMAAGLPPILDEPDGPIRINLPLYDIDIPPALMKHYITKLNEGAAQLANARAAGVNTLVHCAQGVNRSALLIAWYMMLMGVDYDVIIERLTSANLTRSMPALTNPSFRGLVSATASLASVMDGKK